MTTSTAASTHAGRGDGAGATQTADPPTGSRMWSSRLIAALFLAGFLLYGTGSILVTSVVDGDDFLAGVGSMETTLALGAFLMIATAAVDIGKAVIFFPVLDRHGRRTAVAYLATMIFEMAMMTVGVLALLMIIPLAEQAAAGELDARHRPGARVARGRRERDGLPDRAALARLRCALPCALCCSARGWCPGGWRRLGLVGYATHMIGAAAEIFGVPIGLVLLIPGAIFELTLPAWLLIKGFDPAAYDGPPATPGDRARR